MAGDIENAHGQMYDMDPKVAIFHSNINEDFANCFFETKAKIKRLYGSKVYMYLGITVYPNP